MRRWLGVDVSVGYLPAVGVVSQAGQMPSSMTCVKWALRRLPLPYRWRCGCVEAGVADQVICEYLRVEEAALPGLYRLAEAKLLPLNGTSGAAASRRLDLAP